MGRRSGGSDTLVARYLKWNEKVYQFYLDDDDATARPVYLDPTPEFFRYVESVFALPEGEGRRRLIDVVRGVLRAADSGDDLFQSITYLRNRWRTDADARHGAVSLEDRVFPPPVAALLLVSVMAAQDMAESDADGRRVSSTNYYSHLRDVLGLPPAQADKLRRDFTVTEQYWEDLAWWMEELDGRFGLPTARATTHRYIGLPISQAIVRSGDRAALRRMFAQYALAPGEVVSPQEMTEILIEWMSTVNAGAPKELIAKWREEGARARIVDVAISELGTWDGTVERTEREFATRVGLSHLDRASVALVTKGAVAGVEEADLGIAIRGVAADDEWTIVTEHGDSALLPRRLSATTVFTPAYEMGVDAEEILTREISLRSDAGRTMRRVPRRIVLLAEDDAAGAFVEVRRAISGARHRILVSPEAPDEVLARLAQILDETAFAAGGWKDLEIDGVPESWMVIDDFVPARVPILTETLPDELAILVASVSTQFHVRGGIRLPGRVRKWHSDATPEIVITLGSDQGRYDLAMCSLDEDVEWILAEGIRTPDILGVPEDAGDGDYRIELRKAGTVVQSETLRLRSGSTPSVDGLRRREGLGHGPDAVDAVRAVPVTGDRRIVGSVVEGGRGRLARGRRLSEQSWADRHVRQPTATSRISLPRPAVDSCVVTGRHKFLFPTFKGGKPGSAWQTGECQGCGALRRTPTYWKSALKKEQREMLEATRGRRIAAAAVAESVPEDAAIRAEQLPDLIDRPVPPSVFEDVLAHLVSGEMSSLVAVTGQIPGITGDQNQFARDLAALGTIEVGRDTRFRRVRWETAPPAVITLSDGRPALAGAWDLARLAGLEAVVADLGAELIEAEDGSALATVRGATSEELFEYQELEGVLDGGDAATRLAAELPRLSDVEKALPRVDVGLETGPWQMFLHRELAWIDVDGWDAPGLYRRDRGYRRDYWFRSEADLAGETAAPVDVDLGKHLLALRAGSPLIGYDRPKRVLSVPLGARLPELYERAAVHCGGRLPRKSLPDFALFYDDVPPAIASTLYTRMSS